MFSSIFQQYPILLTLFSLAILAQTTSQLALNHESIDLNKVTTHQNAITKTRNTSTQPDEQWRTQPQQGNFKVPFIVLMSDDTISVAQLPLIEDGNLTAVYHLTERKLYPSIGGEETLETFEEQDEEAADEASRLQPADSQASAREYEQMPQSAMSVSSAANTTTSLGKSEWQQIAVGGHDREEALPQMTSRKEDARDEEEVKRPRKRRSVGRRRSGRERRSNSLSLTDDDGNNSNSSPTLTGNSNAAAAAPTATTSAANNTSKNEQAESNDVQANKEANRPEESSSANVTSAQFASIEQPQAKGGLEKRHRQEKTLAEEATDDSGRARNGAGGSSVPEASSSQETWGAPAREPSPNSNGIAVRFCDFDVHMALGYAFVADSAGRIHRFKLLNSQSETNRTKLTLGGGEDEVDEKISAAENDYTNTIDASVNLGTKSRAQSSANDVAKSRGSDLQMRRNATATSSSIVEFDDDDENGESGSNSSGGGGDFNKVNQATELHGTHEQAHNYGRQHPTVSGGPGSLGASERELSSANGSPISGGTASNQLNYYQPQPNDARPTIVWSRSKYASSARAAAATTPASQRHKLANAGGALQKRDSDDQVAGAESESRQMGSGRGALGKIKAHAAGAAVSNDESEGSSDSNEADKRVSMGTARSNDKVRRSYQTEIAVDWMDNLLFVLDKYRLFVVDFDGNNELLLIDDFNANNRPVDIKVDPINDFLFWLQLGKFHNTIYKLDLSLLSMPGATQRLIRNTLKLRQSGRVATNSNSNNSHNNNDGLNLDPSDLVALVSHHHAHPIITNLPRHTRLFTIDHKHSRIYVPLGPAPVVGSRDADSKDRPTDQTDETEVFAASDDVTHLNSTAQLDLFDEGGKNCTPASKHDDSNGGQILAYNLDGTDMGPYRTAGENKHLSNLDMQDMTMDSANGLLYWLTNNGRELFEEYKVGGTINHAQHNLDGKSYSKLIYFNNAASNQLLNQKPRFNMRRLIHMMAVSVSPNRWTRSDYDDQLEKGSMASGLDGRIRLGMDSSRFSRNAPYIILGITCLVVVTVYLMYALIFQQTRAPDQYLHESGNRVCRSGSIEGSSMSESTPDPEGADITRGARFINSSTISRWITRPSACSTDASTLNRNMNLAEDQLESCAASTNYGPNNAVDEHYRDSQNASIQNGSDFFNGLSSSRLANLSEWPTNMCDMSNKLYVPVEVQQDYALSSIHRFSIDQLDIESCALLGEGHFGTVLQGSIKCTLQEKNNLLNKALGMMGSEAPGSPSSLAPSSQARSRLIGSSAASSGHGSSSSTSCEFATANSCSESTNNTNQGDYLTPKSQCNSAMSDYTAENHAHSAIDSCSSYCNTGIDRPEQSHLSVKTKLRVAIKKLKDNASSEEKRDFLQEAKLLANFDHPNIVHLLGICVDRGSTLIVMELMLGGDLIRYMRGHVTNSARGGDSELPYEDLLKICLDIVNACCYLEDLDYIHRDLAARNCLVSSRKRDERVVKLADFGLARDIYKDSYYKKLNDSAMPLKWMAPECLIEQKFTKKSDVWSFGVVMWEVMSYCMKKPYDSVAPGFMPNHLTSGARLSKPDSCDENMYKLMNQCWQLEPEKRPTFQECRAILIEIRNGK